MGKIIKTRVIADKPRRSRVRVVAESTFQTAGMNSDGGWERVDIRIDGTTGEAYVLEVKPTPILPYPTGRSIYDNVIADTYLSGHAAFFDKLVATTRMQFKSADQKTAPSPISATSSPPVTTILCVELEAGCLYAPVDHCLGVYDWTGCMLDLAWGNGYPGEGIHKQGFHARITGVELSPLMARKDAIEEAQLGPIRVAPLEPYIKATAAA